MDTDEDTVIIKIRNISFIFPLISFILSITILIISILYYNEKTNYKTIKAKNADIQNLKTINGDIYNNIQSSNIYSQNIFSNEVNTDTINTNQSEFINIFINSNNSDKIKTNDLNVTNYVDERLVTYENIYKNIKTYNPKQFGYVSMSYKCNESNLCQSQFDPDGKMIYLSNNSQFYHFRNKIPNCVLFDSISDQIIDSSCSSKCSEKCEIMYNDCYSFANQSDLSSLKIIESATKLSKIVPIYQKNTNNIDVELQSYNPSNSPCFIFTDNTSKDINTNIINDTYSELIIKIFFNNNYGIQPYVDAYLTSYNSKTSLKNKKTNKEWKKEYGNDGANPDTFCLYKNLNSFLYEDDIFTGDSRINFGISVQEVTNEYFKIVISNNYGFKFSNSFTFTYLIY